MSSLTPASFVPIAVTVRSGCSESVHHGALVALGRDGTVAFAVGDPEVEVYPRSSMKPLQATAMVRAGLDVPLDLLALACASHDGSPMHVDGVRRLLARVGLDEHALANTPDLPLDAAAAEDVLRAGGRRERITQNCSGKHAAMLATSAVNGWSTDASYLDPSHPLQRRITDELPDLAGSGAVHIGVDGCGAPAHVMSLLAVTRAYRAIATGAAGPAGDQVTAAMRAHPELVGGPDRDVTLLMAAVPGLIAKDGAEGCFVVALADGRAVGLKVADGANRARPPVMAAALGRLGVDLAAVDARAKGSPVLGHGRPVGEVRSLV